MIRWIVENAIRLRVPVTCLAVLLMIVGIRTADDLPLDVFPEFSPPLIEIQTEAPGLSAAEVESLVSVPLESTLHGTPWLDVIRSKSVEGLSSIVLILEQGADLMEARQLVQERLSLAAQQLPGIAAPPVLLSPLSATSRVLKVGLTAPDLDRMALSTLARWTIRPRLMAVPGVANVAIWGQRDRQFQVLVDPARLDANGVSLDQVVRAATEAADLSTGGFVDTPNQRLSVRHRSQLGSPEDLADAVIPVAPRAVGATAPAVERPLLLGDVTEVVEDWPAPIGEAVIDDGPGILLIVEKEPWGNTLQVTRGVEAAFDALRPGLDGVEVDTTIFRPATFIEIALDNLSRALWIGCVLVVVILVLFLYDWRTAVISSVAIPLSLVVAVAVLSWQGATVNTMVLAGLVIALGEVVDDAIIDVENIVRRLRLNARSDRPENPFRVVVEASLEVRSAVVFGSMIVVIVLVPVFFLEGLAGAFFRPLASAYVLAILASLLVALTVVPALAYSLLSGSSRERRESPLVGLLHRVYERVLRSVVFRPRALAAALLAAMLVAGLSARSLGEEFLPEFQERDFLMHWVGKPGTSLDAMTRSTIRVSEELRAIPGVRNFGAHIGRAEVADEVVGPNFTELWISIDPEVDYPSTVQHIQEVVDGYPGLYRDVLTYLKERVKEVLSGASASIVVRIFGPELGTLRERAQVVAERLADVPGVIDLHVEPQVQVPQIEVRWEPEALAQHGVQLGAARRALTTLVRGRTVGQFFDEQAVFDVAVRGVPEVRASPDALRDVLVDTPSGRPVALGALAEIRVSPAPNMIKRENASRRIDVTCNVRGRDLGRVARDVQSRLEDLGHPQGYHVELLGEFAARQAAQDRLVGIALASLAGILVLLQVSFSSWGLAMLVLLALPFSLIGCIAGAWVGGGTLSLGSLIGCITVFGIASRNAIMLMSHYAHLRDEEGVPLGRDLVLRGARERLAPILMTSLTAGFALLPLVLAGNKPGHEIEYPMAIVIVGGLATATLLTLFILPGVYWMYASRGRSAHGEQAPRGDG